MIKNIGNIDKNKLINDFKALLRLNLPNIDRMLLHKVEETKVMVAMKKRKNAGYANNEDNEDNEENEPVNPKKDSLPPKVEFELHKIKTMWLPFVQDEDINPFIILSLPLIDFIVQNTEEGLIGLNKLVQVKNHLPVKLSFHKAGKSLIKGTIEPIEFKIDDPNGKIEVIEPKDNIQEDLEIFLQYLLSNEAFAMFLLREFILMWKPLIDSGCIGISTK